MTVETDILTKFLEKYEADSKETNRKLEKLLDEVNLVKLGLVRLEGEIKSGQVEIRTVREDVQELNSIYKWVITLIVTLNVGLATLILRVFDLLPKA